ncbi:DsbA family oxidoreductase [Alkalimarinus coralli]|uniref:DsbA family oxidoreductase n=1 Tax=Alkalimarinus coralli TaxID=2935863 RepID=UPI00202B7253|nr:DsbA family oxidoreductase [Alkalimarinus coralli]
MKTLKVEMIHDLVCSWCPIGYANVLAAARNLNITLDFHFLPYELNPNMEPEGEDINDYLKQRYGWSITKRQEYRQALLKVAEQADVCMDFSKRTRYFNSLQGHRLMHWCEGFGMQQAMNDKLIDAYFKHGLDIGNTQVLVELCRNLGLDTFQAQQALTSDEVDQAWQLKKRRVQQLNLPSVPAFIFNDHQLVTGSNSVAYFEQLITDQIKQDNPNVHLAS